jgi:hypothetical protein
MNKVVRINYTIINHEARVRLGLTINEYCVFDLIHNLASNPKNAQMGWCYARKETLAGYLDLGRATVFRAIKKGLDLSLLEKHPDQPALLKATSNWYDTVLIKTESQYETDRLKTGHQTSQSETDLSIKMRTNKDIDKEINNDRSHQKNLRKKNGISAIGEVLDEYELPSQINGQIKHAWQAEAVRLWNELGLNGNPSQEFAKHIKRAFTKKQQGKLAVALSYCKDAVGVRDVEKLFYWRCANEAI